MIEYYKVVLNFNFLYHLIILIVKVFLIIGLFLKF